MTSKERAELRGMANKLQAIFQVGKNGVSDNLIKQLDDALTARELIKITVLETSGDDVRELGREIANLLGAEVVQTIGNKLVFYRKNDKDN